MLGVNSHLFSTKDRIQSRATRLILTSMLLPFLVITSSSPAAQAAPNPTELSLAGGNFTLARDASASGDLITLTPALTGKAGAAFSKNRIDVRETFTVTAELNLGTRTTTGADGIAFVLQPNSSTTLTVGGGIGYDGVTNAFAVEFDTWQNGSELANDHAGLMKNSVSEHTQWGVNPVDLGEIEDGQWRTVEFNWVPALPASCVNAAEGQFTAKYDRNFDGDLSDAGETLFDNVCIDLEGYFASAGYTTYFGFTAATGGSVNLQQVRTLSAVATPRVNTPPTINSIPDETVAISSTPETVSVTIGDESTSGAQWTITQSSSNTSVVSSVSSTGYSTFVGITGGVFTLSYTAASAGTSIITVTAEDADGASVEETFTVTVYGLTPATQTFAGESGTPLSTTAYTTIGFSAPPTFTISPALPTGLSIDPSTSVITGIPTESQTVTTYLVTATNGGESATATLKLTISPGTRSLDPSPQTVAATKWVAITPTTAYTPVNFLTAPTYAVSGSTLPAGLSINSSSGQISGTPTVAQAAANYSILASNANGETATAIVSIEVVALTPELSPSAQTLTGIASTALTASANYAATGFVGTPITYALSGETLTAGLIFDTSTGVISGTPTTVKAVTTYTVTATTSLGESASATITLTISSGSGGVAETPLVEWITKSVPNGNVASPYAFTLAARYATIYSIFTGQLPAGLALNPATGAISGTPTTTGTYQFTVLGNNSFNRGQVWSFTLVVAAALVAPEVSPTPVTPPASPVTPPASPVEPPASPVELEPIAISIKQKVYFAMSSFVLNAKAKSDLRALAKKALGSGTSFQVTIVGFTQPTVKDPNFKALANNRARAAANFLRSLGVMGSYSINGVGQAPRNVPSSRYAEVTVVALSR